MNKLTFLLQTGKQQLLLFSLSVAQQRGQENLAVPLNTHIDTHSHFLHEHKFLCFKEIVRCLTNFFTNKKIYIFIHINYDNPISFLTSLKIIFLCYLSWFQNSYIQESACQIFFFIKVLLVRYQATSLFLQNSYLNCCLEAFDWSQMNILEDLFHPQTFLGPIF